MDIDKPPALSTQGLTVCYKENPVLWNVDLKVPANRMVAIVGPNGAGKSTLLKSCLGLMNTLAGSISFLGQPLKKMRLDVAYVPQRESVDWEFPINVYDLVMMGRYGRLGWLHRPGLKDKQIVEQALEQVCLQEYKDRQISELSGGQQQRAFLARALAQQARVYFMDEPFAAVDHATERQLVALMRQLCSHQASIFVVHHDLATLKEYFDWIVLLNGRLVASGPVEEVLRPEILEQAYGRPVWVV